MLESCRRQAADDTWPVTATLPIEAGAWRVRPEDFFVDENLGLTPSGDGEFEWVRIEKVGLNTAEVAEQLARWAGLPRRAVSYSGMKDRHAVTRQWFSLHLPGRRSPDWRTLNVAGIKVLDHRRHHRKLRIGTHAGNDFRLVLRELRGVSETLSERLDGLARDGVPNYFGPQRFGRDGGNLIAAVDLYHRGRRLSRHRAGLCHSAARALIFNRLLGERVAAADWNCLLPGDVAGLAGSGSVFACERIDPDLERRCRDGDLHPTGPLWGRGTSLAGGEVAERERRVAATLSIFANGLEGAGISASRRPLRCLPEALEWSLNGDALVLSFGLSAGQFATALVRELMPLQAVAH